MGKSVTLGWLCPRTVTLVTEPPFCDMSYMSLPIVTFGCTQMVRAERHRSGSKPPKIDPAIQIEVEAAIRIDVAVNQRGEDRKRVGKGKSVSGSVDIGGG